MQTYRFGEFDLDLQAQQLLRRGQPVRLERRPWELLVLLVTRHGCLVGREEIIAAVWPAKVIIDFDSGLNTLVRKVRHALGDSPDNPRFIETVPGRGYRFIAPVVAAAEPDSAPVPPIEVRSKWGRRSHQVAAALVLLLAAAGAMIFVSGGDPEAAQTRIAVLPFENLTGDDGLGYLAAGLAEDTSASLAQIELPDLAVIGGVSARALAESALPLQEIARDVGVDFVVQSSLRRDESRIRVTSRLIRLADGEQVWTASFDRRLTNILGLQRELGIAIAEQVRQRLSPDVAAAINRRQTQNPGAYALYLKGRYEWTRFLPDSIPRALQYYEQAVAEDPGYALAWAGIAHALITSPVTREANRDSVVSAAQDALQRALEYGPELAEAQLALGSYHYFLDWDMPPAEAAARKAVSLDPNSAMSHMFLGIVLAQRGKHVEARAMLRRARELDPLFPLMFANSAVVALMAEDPQSALEFSTQAIAINPEFWVGYLHLGGAYLELGSYEAALDAFAVAVKLSDGNSTRAASYKGYILAKLGRTDEARDVLAQLTARAADEYVPPYAVAVIHAGLDDVEGAFDWLNRALAERDAGMLWLARDRRLDALRSDMRFESLLRRCRCAGASGNAT